MDVEKIVREYIDQTPHMSLATVHEDRPWVCEVHFVYDKDLNLYFRSKAARRHSLEIASNPRVAGNIVRQHTLEEAPHGIYFEGIAEHLDDESERQTIFSLFTARLGTKAEALDEASSPDGHQFYKIRVENWYAFGRFGQPTSGKYALSWNGGKKDDSSDT